ncbi:MAG: carbohydrate kinase family protein, partial [Clostridiales bacterium]|nr:carbohydrate kinase family protein [Clostridiales bacterium]
VVLSLNGNEQRIVRRALGLSDSLDDLAAAAEIRQTLGLWRVALHARAGCQMASADGVCHLPTPAIVERPAILTGAGDAFNAGLCAALLLGWDDELCLALASKVAGHYVARGEPPRIEQLIPQ